MAYERTSEQHRRRFERAAKSVKGVWYREDTGQLTNRNSKSTTDVLEFRFAEMKESFRALVAAHLDTDRDWALFNKVERRYVMGKDYADWAKQAGL